MLPFIFLSGSQVCLNLSCFFSWFPCLVLACLALLASPRLVCFPFLRQWPLWATRAGALLMVLTMRGAPPQWPAFAAGGDVVGIEGVGHPVPGLPHMLINLLTTLLSRS